MIWNLRYNIYFNSETQSSQKGYQTGPNFKELTPLPEPPKKTPPRPRPLYGPRVKRSKTDILMESLDRDMLTKRVLEPPETIPEASDGKEIEKKGQRIPIRRSK